MPGRDDHAPASRSTRSWCLFRVNGEPFAVGLEVVAEVVEVERLVRLPLSPARVLGFCTLRREVIAVVSLTDDTGDAPARAGPGGKSLVLVLRTGQGSWAIRIDPDGIIVATEPLEGPRPPRALGAMGPVLLGAVRRGETAYSAVDPVETWRVVRGGVEHWYTDHWTTGAPARVETDAGLGLGGEPEYPRERPIAARGRTT